MATSIQLRAYYRPQVWHRTRGRLCFGRKGQTGFQAKKKATSAACPQKGVLAAWLSVQLYFLKGRPRVSIWLSCRGLVAAKASMGGAGPWADS